MEIRAPLHRGRSLCGLDPVRSGSVPFCGGGPGRFPAGMGQAEKTDGKGVKNGGTIQKCMAAWLAEIHRKRETARTAAGGASVSLAERQLEAAPGVLLLCRRLHIPVHGAGDRRYPDAVSDQILRL